MEKIKRELSGIISLEQYRDLTQEKLSASEGEFDVSRREEHFLFKCLLIGGVVCQFDVFYSSRYLRGAFSFLHRQQRQPRARPSRVSHGLNSVGRNGGNKADSQRAFDSDLVAERAGQLDLVQIRR